MCYAPLARDVYVLGNAPSEPLAHSGAFRIPPADGSARVRRPSATALLGAALWTPWRRRVNDGDLAPGNPASLRCRWCKRAKHQITRRSGSRWQLCDPCDALTAMTLPRPTPLPPEDEP